MLYMRFWNAEHRLKRESPFHRRRGHAYHYTTPGHIGHLKQLSKKRRIFDCFPMFEHWCGRSEKAEGLYWRTHKDTTP